MAGRPEKTSERLRHALSTVYASETRSGSREFQASSAARALTAAVSRVNGGNGGRPCAAVAMSRRSEMLGEGHADGARGVGHRVGLQSAQRHGVARIGTGLERRALGITRDLGAFVRHVLHEQLDAPAVVVDAGGDVEDVVRGLLAQQLTFGSAQVGPGAALVHPRTLQVRALAAERELVAADGITLEARLHGQVLPARRL